MAVRVQQAAFDAGREMDALRAGNPQVGAVACFVGVVRDFNDDASGKCGGKAVATLTLEHYPGMTEKALADIEAQARARWSLCDVLVVHRVGTLAPTEPIVLVVTTSAHRGEAFAACQFIMDYLKTDAPFWKKEATPQGTRWVDARATDDAARARWEKP